MSDAETSGDQQVAGASRARRAATRLADHADPVPDEIWDQAARHYDEPALAALVAHIATINAWNRLNVTTARPVNSRRSGPVEPLARATEDDR